MSASGKHRKTVLLSDHAGERFLERRIPAKVIKNGLERGVMIPDKEEGRRLCIYKVGKEEYYTLVVEESEDAITIITVYGSSEWEKRAHKRLMKHGSKKN